MRMHCGNLGTRASALWGTGGGKGRSAAVLLALSVVLVVPATGTAGGAKPRQAVVPASLLAAANANPAQLFSVIVQGNRGKSTANVANDVADVTGEHNSGGGADRSGKVKRAFHSISGVAVTLSGKDVLKLARHPDVLAITPDAPVKAQSYENGEMWRTSTDVAPLWETTDPLTGLVIGPAPQAPTVALVDSGVDASKLADFGSRVLASVNLSSLSPDTATDEEGHGTMVAGVLAGSSALYPGVAPNAPIVSVKTADRDGRSMTSDVIAAADWILAHKGEYNIRVANFSMAGASTTSFRYDPLDRAAEQLWFDGVVVVAAAGNHGSADGPVDMSFAPGNDPFVITVGALDQHQTGDPLDDTVPSWSAYGHTMDGFSKPDMAAPGRYIVGPVPADSTIATTVPDRIVAPGYIWMSGTSLAAPVVSGAAAQILARHPDWTPDMVKGALMLTSANLGFAGPEAAGVGEIDAAFAASLDFDPPNPNENLYAFVHPDPTTGQPTFDQVSWSETVASNPSWSAADWSAVSWDSAKWDVVSWSDVSWDSVSWDSTVDTEMATLVSWSESAWSE